MNFRVFYGFLLVSAGRQGKIMEKTEVRSLKTEVEFFWFYFLDGINRIDRIFHHEALEKNEWRI